MGFLKNLLIGGAALKIYKGTQRPGVVEPDGFTLLNMKHVGFGSSWRITYLDDRNKNVKKSFTISKGTTI